MTSSPAPIAHLPRALARSDEVAARVASARVAVFLDYDGTLTPIVADPASARIDAGTRRVLTELAAVCPVAIVSGRDLSDVRHMVGVDGLTYAGSHGFDIVHADGTRTEQGTSALGALDAAEAALVRTLRPFGARVERKRFAIAVHYRGIDPALVPRIEAAVTAAAENNPGLRVTSGKMIVELRPDLPWDKGRALLALLEATDPTATPLYIGDDVTDEDAFRAVRGRGLGLVVSGEDDQRHTLAEYVLSGPAEVVTFLQRLARRLA